MVEEVAGTRTDSIPGKARAQPKQEKLKPVTKTETQATSRSGKPVKTETAATEKAKPSLEDDGRVLPTGEVETVPEMAEREEFERPEVASAVVAEVTSDVTDRPTLSKEAKIIEVYFFDKVI